VLGRGSRTERAATVSVILSHCTGVRGQTEWAHSRVLVGDVTRQTRTDLQLVRKPVQDLDGLPPPQPVRGLPRHHLTLRNSNSPQSQKGGPWVSGTGPPKSGTGEHICSRNTEGTPRFSQFCGFDDFLATTDVFKGGLRALKHGPDDQGSSKNPLDSEHWRDN